MYVRGDQLDFAETGFDFSADLGVGCQCGMTQPVVAHHAAFVWVRDCARFKRLHRGECGLHTWLHFRQESVTEVDPASVDREVELVNMKIVLFESFPGHDWCKVRIKSWLVFSCLVLG